MADTAVLEQEAPDSGSSGSGSAGATGGRTISSGPLEAKSEDGDGDMMDADVSGSNVNYDSSGDGMSSSVLTVSKVLKKGSRMELLHDGDMVDIDVENQDNNNSQCSTQASALAAAATTSTAAGASNATTPPAPSVGGSVHPSRKMFECDVCNMKFSNGANMRRHKMRHTGVKPYECRVCQKRFFRKDHLAEHFTTHTKTLPYHCPICNRGFQRQIAMRAHFQNEHVGQHDLVKSCPLCSYRAGSMKSLRIHFFNRHGIDLDNPSTAPGGSASLLAAAAQQGYQLDSSSLTSLGNLSTSLSVSMTTSGGGGSGGGGGGGGQTPYSDSGDSTGARSTDNATPPMHYLTPHVEISMAGEPGTTPSNGASGGGGRSGMYSPNMNDSSSLTNNHNHISHHAQNTTEHRLMNGTSDGPNSPQSADSNSNAPSSTHSHQLLAAAAAAAAAGSVTSHHYGTSTTTQRLGDNGETTTTTITPSISLIPIKQEPMDMDSSHHPYDSGPISNGSGSKRHCGPLNLSSTQVQLQTATSSSLSSIIKVSPLKSLLREDLKRKLVSRGLGCGSGGGRGSRGISSPPNGTSDMCSTPNLPSSLSTTLTTSADSNPHTNGTITSTGPDQPSDSSTSTTLWVRSSTAKRAAALIATGLQCPFCGIGFPDQTLYFLHKGCHSDANPWKCNICGEQCCNVYEFNSHLLSKSHQ